MQIDNALLGYLEDLSYLFLTDEEKSKLAGELKEILQFMARLSELDTDGVPECSHPFDKVNSFRADRAELSSDRVLILQNAPLKNAEMFIVPQTLDNP